MTIKEALKSTIEIFEIKIKNPYLEAELLLSVSLDKPRSFIMTYPEYILTESELMKLHHFTKKRLDDTPLAYLTNTKSFYGLDFYVDENVLIPRPETELMVDTAIDIIKNQSESSDEINIIDIGTGSGCIIISIANEIQKFNLKTKFYFDAVDISPEALNVAKQNAKNHTLNKLINFQKGNLLNSIRKFVIDSRIRRTIIITANLPYLTIKQIKSSTSIKKEPKLALDGGIDGMDLYIELFKQTVELKKTSESDIIILAEIDHTQKDIFVIECKNIIPEAKIEVMKDLGGYERLLTVKC